MSWGSSTADESKPNWTWLTTDGRKDANGNPTAPKSANVHATEKGWVHRWPWGDEVIVAIGGLATGLGNATMSELHVGATPVVNAAAQTLALLVSFNEAVTVTGTPTIRAISAGANTANVVLSYVSAQSDPSAGRLVFANTALDLSTANVTGTLTVNATSTLTGFDNVKDAGNANAVTNAIATGLSAVFTIEAAPEE